MSFDLDMIAKAPELAAKLKLLSNPNRLMIVCRLLKGEMSVGEIESELKIRQPTLSRELGHLRDAGILTPRRQSKVVFYSLTSTEMRQLMEAICDTTRGRKSLRVNRRPLSDQAIAFNPRVKFTKAGFPPSENRGYSVFASLSKEEA